MSFFNGDVRNDNILQEPGVLDLLGVFCYSHCDDFPQFFPEKESISSSGFQVRDDL